MSKGNREYKSDVFSMLMQDKKNALSVYNALNKTNYTNPDDVEIQALDKGISLSVRNDAAFMVGSAFNIYEHQSTVCPNMPVRDLIYFTTFISRFIKGRNIYGRSLVKLPVLKFVVFYNGDEEQPEKYEMRLSDSYEKKTDSPELELVCRVYNINFGRNNELLSGCDILREYAAFVEYVRYYDKEQCYDGLEAAINLAIDRCIEEGILSEFLKENRTEVVKVMQLDYTFDRQIVLERREARVEGHSRGLAEGRSKGLTEGVSRGRLEEIISSVCEGDYSIERGAEKLGISVKEFEDLMKKQQ